ncbi:glycosyltransferase 87 family protein [Rhodococcus daqingensis]|uniref:Glycosyltransferase 87 family protein n=1 Tax=Rhodococcus daqingensis TaxID=2479363 RepID=A0ABW2S3W4_9NOCA
MLVLGGAAATAVVLVMTTVDPWLNGAGILAGGADLHVYRDGAFRILRGLPLYTEPVLFGLQYTYTPFSTIVFIPIERIPWGSVNTIWMGINLGVILACILLSWQLLGYRVTPRLVGASALLTLTSTFLEPVRTTLFYGQINLVLMLLVLWDFSRADRSRLRGLGVGLAAGIKLTPVYFVALFVVLRQWRSAAVASAAIGASIVLTWTVLPTDSREYWTSTFFQSTRIADDTHPSNQSIRGVIAHLTGHATPTWLWILIAGGVGIVSLLVAARLHRDGDRLLAVVLCGLTACAVSPYSWSHHWVWFVPLLVYLVHLALAQRWWWAAAGVLVGSAGAWPYVWDERNVVIGVFLFPPSWPITAILVNAYVIVFACVLGGAVVRVGRFRDQGAPEDRDQRPGRGFAGAPERRRVS